MAGGEKLESIIIAITTAIIEGDLEQVKALLKQNPKLVNEHEKEFGETLVHTAARWGHKDVVDLLLTHGAEVNAQNKVGITPLFIAANEGHENVVKLLLAHGAEINIKTVGGRTLLHVAAGRGLTEVV